MKVSVIGSGFGGIAAALRMRAKGHEVVLIEKLNEIVNRLFKSEIEELK